MLRVGRKWAASTPDLPGFCFVTWGLFMWQFLLTWPLTSARRAFLKRDLWPTLRQNAVVDLLLTKETHQWRLRQWRRRALSALLDFPARRSAQLSECCAGAKALGLALGALERHNYRRRRRNIAATMKRIGVGVGAEGRFRKCMTCTLIISLLDHRLVTRNVI